jgi:NADH:ubiquinone oxidoreductase subunit F (NADH-binding)/NADH:ubiquinone oxidoreductase subunit E
MMNLQEELGFLSDETLRRLAKEKRVPLYRLEGLVSFYPVFRRTPPPTKTIHICRDVACKMHGADQLKQAILDQHKDDPAVEIHEVSCIGRCESAPALAIDERPHTVDSNDFGQLLEIPNKIYGPWKCDPYSTAAEHHNTVKSLVESSADLGQTCIDELLATNLRGMGGAGFPTGRKWDLVRSESADPKYVICNADESEPGTFKDRVILNELPHLVVEGMVLAGLTIGAERGIVYLRHEYAPEQAALEQAIESARAAGILGSNAAGSGQTFEVEIFVSPGGYILGEETALLEALEDKRGEPRNKPPYPGTHGLWGKPTLINNVETYALATCIINRGAEWWKSQGAEGFHGLKFVSISGDVARPGVYEIPIGITVAELIDQCGGVRDGRELQAFLPGGASSNFLPASKAHTPIDFDAMKAAGSMLGTGAVIVIGDQHRLLDLATNIVQFFRNESCGKCVPCRMGSQKAVEILEHQQASSEPLVELEILPELAETLEQTSICGLGQVALNPILSLMNHIPGAIGMKSDT